MINIDKTKESEGAKDEDITELQRRCRKLEEGKKTFAETSKAQDRTISATITRLKREHTLLQERLRLLTEPEHQKKTSDLTRHICQMIEKHSIEMEEIQEMQDQAQELKRKTLDKESEHRQVERDIEGQSNVIKKRKETEKRIAVLEDRVDYATKSCNEQLKKNKELKLRIQGLMLERSTHDALCKELEDKMSKRRRDLSRLVSRLSRTYEQREAAEARLNHLTQLETDDSHSAAAEIQHLRRFLTQQQRLEKFLGQKAAIRTPESVEETAPSTQKKHSLPCITTEQAIFTEEIANLYETVLAKLTKLCGEKLKKDRSSTNIVVDVVEFIGKREKQNLALYAYINELQAHASELYGQIRAIQKSVSGLRSSLGIPSRTAYAYVGEEDSSSSQDLPSIQLKISDELDLDEDSENARFLETTSIFEEVATKVKAMKDLLGSRDTTLGRILADESDTERKGRQVDPSENPKEHKAVKTFLKQVKTTMVTERNINHHVIIINQKASRILNFRIQTKHSSSSSAGKKEPILSGLRRRVYAPPEVREEDMLTDAKSDSPVISSSGSDSSAPSRARSPAVGAKKKKSTGKKKTSKSRKSKK